ncbi:MAG: DUF2442 domain-containing protein [Proteobacteria bacterium]|nr:DUF2442 domain-containing protein [Pseudomonadota bacterium]
MVKIISVEPLVDYKLKIEFSNGKKGVFDVSPYIDKGVFNELKEQSYFCSVRPAFGGIMWPHEQDFSADTVEYELQEIG